MKNLLSLGWICATLFILGSLILGSLLPDYSLVSMTLSEIGEVGSAFYYQWKALDTTCAILILLFAFGTFMFCARHQLSYMPAIFLLAFALSNVGGSFFPSPHPLHNVFGISTTVGYFSPLIFYKYWQETLGAQFKRVSLIVFIIVITSIFFNLSPLIARSLYSMDYYGLVQRSLGYTFYLYCAYVSIKMISFDKKQSAPLVDRMMPL